MKMGGTSLHIRVQKNYNSDASKANEMKLSFALKRHWMVMVVFPEPEFMEQMPNKFSRCLVRCIT